jgi:hypothetical protein
MSIWPLFAGVGPVSVPPSDGEPDELELDPDDVEVPELAPDELEVDPPELVLVAPELEVFEPPGLEESPQAMARVSPRTAATPTARIRMQVMSRFYGDQTTTPGAKKFHSRRPAIPDPAQVTPEPRWIPPQSAFLE